MIVPAPETEAAVLACEIGDAIWFSFGDATDPTESEYLNADGAWEYHFETDSAWGFVAGGPDGPVTTTYDGQLYCGGKLTLDPYQWCVFYEDAPVAVFSSFEVTIGGPDSLEAAMMDALRTERDALARHADSSTEVVR